MKLAIYTRTGNAKISELEDLLESLSVDYEVNPQKIDDRFSALLTLGGDGTLLDAVRQFDVSDSCPPILGVNSGRLGFLASVGLDDCRSAIEALIAGDYELEGRSMLEITDKNTGETFTALNEFTAQRRGVSMVEISMKIGGVEVASYWADGVIISTPTGSTAYSMSVGGAILTPDSPCFIISPVAPHNLNMRPLVISNSSVIDLYVKSRYDEGAIVTIDNTRHDIPEGQHFELKQSRKTLQFIHLKQNNFYDTLRKKLYWGIDVRQ